MRLSREEKQCFRLRARNSIRDRNTIVNMMTPELQDDPGESPNFGFPQVSYRARYTKLIICLAATWSLIDLIQIYPNLVTVWGKVEFAKDIVLLFAAAYAVIISSFTG